MNERLSKFPAFDNRMSRTQTVLGWIYLPLHIVVIPLLLAMLRTYAPDMDLVETNLLYYGAGALFTAVVMGKYLRSHFDTLLDRLLFGLMAVVTALIIEYVLTLLVSVVLIAVEDSMEAPAGNVTDALLAQDYGIIKGIVIFIGPIVEEVLFRGVAFGSLQKKNRALAYVVSAVLFGLYHVWQAVVSTGEWTLLIYAIQYIPGAVALAWLYERSGSIWMPVFYHMLSNALSFYVLSLL